MSYFTKKRVLSILSVTKNNEDVKPLDGYVKKFDHAKTMCILINDEKLLITYKEIWSEIKKIMKRKKIDSSPMFRDTRNNYLKTKIKSYYKKSPPICHGKAPQEGLKCLCLSSIVIDCVCVERKTLSNYLCSSFRCFSVLRTWDFGIVNRYYLF